MFRVIVGVMFLALVQPAYAFLTDSEINFNVIQQIGRDYRVRYLSIEVTTRDCIVSLVGAAYTQGNAMELVAIAYGTSGVRDVDTSRLTLEFGRPISLDSIIIGKLHGAFSKANIMVDGRSWLGIYAKNAQVCLWGTVLCPEIYDKAVAIARSIPGVRGVTTAIRVLHRDNAVISLPLKP